MPAPYIPPEEFVYDDDDDAPVEDDAFADFDGQVRLVFLWFPSLASCSCCRCMMTAFRKFRTTDSCDVGLITIGPARPMAIWRFVSATLSSSSTTSRIRKDGEKRNEKKRQEKF